MNIDNDNLAPEQQNAINRSMDEGVKNMLIDFVHRSEETQESLLKAFVYFKAENISTQGSERSVTSGREDRPRLSELSNNGQVDESSTLNEELTVMNKENKNCLNNDDELEEEVLEEGIKSGLMSSKSSEVQHPKRPTRKFGNFVDEAEGSDEDIDKDGQTSGYTASFAETENSSAKENAQFLTEKHMEKIEKLPHATEQITDCELSALVDDTYDPACMNTEDEDVHSSLNPGEVEPEEELIPTLSDLQQVTCLTWNSSSKDTEETFNKTDEVCTDEVEPFSLDEDFDYDNVKLTPKFTAQELQYLQSFLTPEPNPS